MCVHASTYIKRSHQFASYIYDHTCQCVYVYIYIHVNVIDTCKHLHIYIYIVNMNNCLVYVCICMYMYIYIYIFICGCRNIEILLPSGTLIYYYSYGKSFRKTANGQGTLVLHWGVDRPVHSCLYLSHLQKGVLPCFSIPGETNMWVEDSP